VWTGNRYRPVRASSTPGRIEARPTRPAHDPVDGPRKRTHRKADTAPRPDPTTKQYAYLLDTPGTAGDANSEITATSNTQFIVDERDSNANGGDKKSLYKIDPTGATDLTGLTPGSKTPEAYVGNGTTSAAATDLLSAASITPVAKALFIEVRSLAAQLDPSGHFYLHDKVEGVATADGGRTLDISNDRDFGIDKIVAPDGSPVPSPFGPPWRVRQKAFALTGLPDRGVILKVDTTKLTSSGAAQTQTVTVSITVRSFASEAPLPPVHRSLGLNSEHGLGTSDDVVMHRSRARAAGHRSGAGDGGPGGRLEPRRPRHRPYRQASAKAP
jgi:hypothetical protein